MTPRDEQHLRAAIELSRSAHRHGNEPYGALLVDAVGMVLATAENTQITTRDCTGHAELNLLREASRSIDAATLAHATVYASGEPCAMCAGAIYWSNVRRVVFALDGATMRSMSGDDEIDLSCREVFARGAHAVTVIGPALVDEARAVLDAHYGGRSPESP